MMIEDIRVGIADFSIANPPNKLITVGLGSCVGIALYDKISTIGGLAHIMLPDSTQFGNITNPIKFADLAIPILIEKMQLKGVKSRNVVAKIAGGASMFNFPDKSMVMDIGNRNSIAVKEVLSKLSIPIIGVDVGGKNGRTMVFDTASGIVQIKTVGLGIKEI